MGLLNESAAAQIYISLYISGVFFSINFFSYTKSGWRFRKKGTHHQAPMDRFKNVLCDLEKIVRSFNPQV